MLGDQRPRRLHRIPKFAALKVTLDAVVMNVYRKFKQTHVVLKVRSILQWKGNLHPRKCGQSGYARQSRRGAVNVEYVALSIATCIQVLIVSKGCDRKELIGVAMNVAERRAV